MTDPVEIEYDSIKLVGMDIISMGDFLVTNKDRTKFAFRVPSDGSSPI